MAWLALFPGRLLEWPGNWSPRGMTVHDRTRLIGWLQLFLKNSSVLPVQTLVIYEKTLKKELAQLFFIIYSVISGKKWFFVGNF